MAPHPGPELDPRGALSGILGHDSPLARAALSGQSPEARRGAPLARGLDGESARRDIMVVPQERPSRGRTERGASIWGNAPSNHSGSKIPWEPSTTRSARGCHPCLRYDSLPMSPVRTTDFAGGRTRTRTLDPLIKSQVADKAKDLAVKIQNTQEYGHSISTACRQIVK